LSRNRQQTFLYRSVSAKLSMVLLTEQDIAAWLFATNRRPARSLFALGLDALRKLFAPRTFAQSLPVLLGLLTGSLESLIHSKK
jgi:hypothetical protein